MSHASNVRRRSLSLRPAPLDAEPETETTIMEAGGRMSVRSTAVMS